MCTPAAETRHRWWAFAHRYLAWYQVGRWERFTFREKVEHFRDVYESDSDSDSDMVVPMVVDAAGYYTL